MISPIQKLQMVRNDVGQPSATASPRKAKRPRPETLLCDVKIQAAE
jgi:hypothetical protein